MLLFTSFANLKMTLIKTLCESQGGCSVPKELSLWPEAAKVGECCPDICSSACFPLLVTDLTSREMMFELIWKKTPNIK